MADRAKQQQNEKQVQQMVEFIKSEAKEKAREITDDAQSAANALRSEQVNTGRKLLNAEFDEKKKNIEIQKRTMQSREVNSNRLNVLRERDRILNVVRDNVSLMLEKVVDSEPDRYRSLVRGLLLQGAYTMNEENLLVRCRACDKDLVQSMLSDVCSEIKSKLGRNQSITIDTKNILPPAPQMIPTGNPNEKKFPETLYSLGGVVLSSMDTKITCDNTLEARLGIVFSQKLPEIKQGLFGKSAAVVHSGH
jgi:V-type H+-transporting ATPase subunit E